MSILAVGVGDYAPVEGRVIALSAGLVQGWRPLPKSQQIKFMNKGGKKKKPSKQSKTKAGKKP